MPTTRRRLHASFVIAALLLAMAATAPSAQAAPRASACGHSAPGYGLITEAASRLASWLAGFWVAAPAARPGRAAAVRVPQATCDAGSQMDPNGRCVPVAPVP